MKIKAYQSFIHNAALEYKKYPSAVAQTTFDLLSTFDITNLLINKKVNRSGIDLNDVDSKNKISFSIDSHGFINELLKGFLNNNDNPLLHDLNNCYESLAWRPSGFGRLPAEITNHVAVVEIIGPSGMIEDSRFRFGLLLQDPEIHYAKHQHAAEELYLVLHGEAAWAVDDNEPSIRGVGEFIHHAENQPHQMKTKDKPLLAMWTWLGDIDSESYSI
ncbi:MAG: mannose-6-phosphate isomerase-like protein (cupin superfamily) [Cocleimonas sp.]|jgi:mannose-6-phosphate isomerase-like protein (cupin superfamily)